LEIPQFEVGERFAFKVLSAMGLCLKELGKVRHKPIESFPDRYDWREKLTRNGIMIFTVNGI